jgi:hypothetical protein
LARQSFFGAILQAAWPAAISSLAACETLLSQRLRHRQRNDRG